MKKLFLALAVLTMSFSLSAQETPKCEKNISEPVLKRINKIWPGLSVETRTIAGIKPLHIGTFLETYTVLASDEVEPSEWIVVVNAKTCKLKYVGVTNDGSVSELWDEFFGL